MGGERYAGVARGMEGGKCRADEPEQDGGEGKPGEDVPGNHGLWEGGGRGEVENSLSPMESNRGGCMPLPKRADGLLGVCIRLLKQLTGLPIYL